MKKYLESVYYAIDHNSKVNRDGKPDFFLVCPCCGTQANLHLFCDNGINVMFGNAEGTQGEFHYPFDAPHTPNFNSYYELVNGLQDKETDYMLEAKYLYLGVGNPSPYKRAYDNNGKNLFVLSPCWGLVGADFKLPRYNFEFRVRQNLSNLDKHYRYISNNGEDNCSKWIRKGFNHLDSEAKKNPQKPIVVLGGRNYIYRFYGIYNNCGWENPVYAIVGEINVANDIGNPDNWTIKQIKGHTNWHYNYMKII